MRPLAQRHFPKFCAVALCAVLLCGMPARAADSKHGESVSRSQATWLFLPLGKKDCPLLSGLRPKDLVADTSPSFVRPDEPAEKDTPASPLPVWHEARFPHAGFDALNPGREVFGWYGHVFELPPYLLEQDLVLHLGVIDDADITYVNGRPIGRMGDFDKRGSAWNRDREYRIAGDLTQVGPNTILVRVYDKWGLGGIMGVPTLTAALVPAETKWQVASLGGTDGKWFEQAEDLNLLDKLPADLPEQWYGQKLDWKETTIPDTAWNQRQSKPRVFGLYRLRFARPDFTEHKSEWTLDLGPVHDVCIAFLNGKRLGLTGRFPHGDTVAFTETAKRARYILPTALLQRKDNELLVLLYNEAERGGLPAQPGILIETPGLDAGALADAVASLAADPMLGDATRPPVERLLQDGSLPQGNPSFARQLVEFDIAVQSLAWDRAERCLRQLREVATDDTDHARALSASIYLDYLRSRTASAGFLGVLDRRRSPSFRALKTLSFLLRKYPEETVSQSAMQAICALFREAEDGSALARAIRKRFPHSADVHHLAPDHATRGDWPLAYGAEGYALAAMGRKISWYGGSGTSCQLAIPGERDVPRNWLSSTSATIEDPRALLMPGLWAPRLAALAPPPPEYFDKPILPGTKIRRASWWDDHGEQHAFDELGPDMLVSIRIPEGPHRLSFYCLDHDWHATLHPRQQSILLLGEKGELLDVAWIGMFGQGVYERFELTGPRTVTARFLKHRSACVAISGVFLDPVLDTDPSIVPPTQVTATGTVPTFDIKARRSQPLRTSYAEASQFLEAVREQPDDDLARLLEPILRYATTPGLAPVRAWTLRLWRARSLPESSLTRHAERRLKHLGIPVDPAKKKTAKGAEADTKNKS